MGPWLPRVTVALEDRRFYEHRGVDWRATVAACARNLRSRQIVSGASTITQQLVKLANARDRRSWGSKVYEAIVAWKLERRWSKQRILSEYLNRSSYGNRRLGPEAAARAYFGKPARDLTLSEAIFLAGLPQAPTRFNPWSHPEEANRKYARSLARLADLGVITRDQKILLAEPPKILRIDPPHSAPHFVDALVAQNPALRGTVLGKTELFLRFLRDNIGGVWVDGFDSFAWQRAAAGNILKLTWSRSDGIVVEANVELPGDGTDARFTASACVAVTRLFAR